MSFNTSSLMRQAGAVLDIAESWIRQAMASALDYDQPQAQTQAQGKVPAKRSRAPKAKKGLTAGLPSGREFLTA